MHMADALLSPSVGSQGKNLEMKKAEGSRLGTSVSGIVGGALTLGLSY